MSHVFACYRHPVLLTTCINLMEDELLFVVVCSKCPFCPPFLSPFPANLSYWMVLLMGYVDAIVENDIGMQSLVSENIAKTLHFCCPPLIFHCLPQKHWDRTLKLVMS